MSDRFGDYLIEKGILQRDDVMKALEYQAESTVKIGTICLEERYMTVKQVMDTLRTGVDTARPFEDQAITLGYLTAQQLGHALKIQTQRRPFFGEILVTLEFIERKQLFEELGKFWTRATQKAADPSKDPTDITAQMPSIDSHTLDVIEIPLMYPEELHEFREETQHALQQVALGLTNFKPGANIPEVAGRIAFITNKMRGGAELDGMHWLAELTGEMERGMLLIGDGDSAEGIMPVIQLYFRATDCIQSFLDSIGGNEAVADIDMAKSIKEAVQIFGSIGDIATQNKIGQEMGSLKKAQPKQYDSLKGLHVLLIDDDTVIRNTLERHLRGKGMEVEQAKNGAIGLERLLQTMSPFDFVIVDLHMPIMDGFDFVAEVRSRPEYQDLPICMFTASLHMADVRKAMDLGISGYVIKREWKHCLMPEIGRILGLPASEIAQLEA
jgi:CheY-like chemotaxis protein